MASAEELKSDARPSMVIGAPKNPDFPFHLMSEETVTMVFPHDLSLNLDEYMGLVHFKAGVQEVPVSLAEGSRVKVAPFGENDWGPYGLHWYLKQQGVARYKKPEPEGPEITEHHVKFLQAKGYAVTTVEGAAEFVKRLTGLELARFFAEAKDWKPEPAKPPVTSPVEPVAVNLDLMTKAQIVKHADEEHGLELDVNDKKDDLIAAVEAHAAKQAAENSGSRD